MRILAIDIGGRTADILVYDSRIELENSPKFILPSPTHYFADEVRKIKENLIIYGRQMGGGSFARAIREHLKKYKVYMTEEAAKTIRNNLDEVRSEGIELISETEVNRVTGRKMKIGDLELDRIYEMLKIAFIDPDFDAISVAVQDHGFSQTGRSNRECRFEVFREKLKTNRRIKSFAYLDDVPKEFSRMNSLLVSIRQYYDKHIIIMDTGPAACLGVLEDVKSQNKKSIMAINIGNLHTIAMSLRNDEICGLFEHHTHLIDEMKLMNLELKLCQAELEFEEVYKDGGHGAISLEKIQPEVVMITGPKRKIAKNLIERSTFFKEAAPAGDPMITGCIGLVKATESLLGGENR